MCYSPWLYENHKIIKAMSTQMKTLSTYIDHPCERRASVLLLGVATSIQNPSLFNPPFLGVLARCSSKPGSAIISHYLRPVPPFSSINFSPSLPFFFFVFFFVRSGKMADGVVHGGGSRRGRYPGIRLYATLILSQKHDKC